MALNFYQHFQAAYDFYNKRLFDGKLDDCLIVFQRKSRTFGYISYNRHSIVGETQYLHELALNPDYFAYRTVIETLSTLVHEQCHLMQHLEGTETRKTYHNQAFRDLMFERGLQTSHTGEEEGKQVGQNMSHYIMHDGLFLEVTLEFLKETDFKTFYDRFTPKYIEPYQFYDRSVKFITRMRGKVSVEDIIPPYLVEYLQEHPEILQGMGVELEPDLTIKVIEDEEGVDDPEDEEGVDDPIEPEPEPPAKVDIEEDIEDGDEEAQDGEKEGEGGEVEDLPAITLEVPVAQITAPQEPIKTKTVKVDQIVSALSSPEQLLQPLKQLMDDQLLHNRTNQIVQEVKKAANSKCKFKCDGCKANLWGKESLNVMCGDCNQPFMLVG